MKTEELKAQGLTDEQVSFVMSENGKDIKREQDKASAFKTQLDEANAALKSFEGKDFDALEQERDSWKEKFSALEFDTALEGAVKNLKFTSNAAKKAFVRDFKDTKPEFKDGSFTGFDDYLAQYKESDKAAFADEEAEQTEANKARFTAPISNKAGNVSTGGDILRRAFGLPDEKKQ